MRIYLSKPHMSGKEQGYIDQAFETNFIAPLGPQLNAFEERVSDYLGGGLHCVGLSSGSAALHLALMLAGVGSGDRVWVSSMTFAGGVFPITYLGAIPVFLDLSPDHWTLCPDRLAEELEKANKTNSLPKAIVPTDLYGQSSDLDPIEALAAQYGVKLIVDSAESLGSSYLGGRKCGTGGDAAILSFNGNKIITTSGGGMLVTRHKEWAEEARFYATQARDPAPHYQHSKIGFNYRLSNICAAIGLGQMDVLDERVAARRAVFARYEQELGANGVDFMPEPEGYISSRWLSVVRFDPDKTGLTPERARLEFLEKSIETRPLWKPMHMQPVFEGTEYLGAGFDESLFAQCLCLPSTSSLSRDEQDEIIETLSALYPG